MPAEDYADFASGVRDATDSLGDFSDALGDASDAAGDVDLGDLGGELGGEAAQGMAVASQVAKGAVSVATGGGLKEIAGVLLNIASAGLPPGVGTVLTKAVGSKL